MSVNLSEYQIHCKNLVLYKERKIIMVKHIVVWKLRDGLSESEKDGIKENIKRNLENLVGKIDGLYKLNVKTDAIDSSDLMLTAYLRNPLALQRYADHPEHDKVKKANITPYVQSRAAIDFNVPDDEAE